jgi:hypothetical protein
LSVLKPNKKVGQGSAASQKMEKHQAKLPLPHQREGIKMPGVQL